MIFHSFDFKGLEEDLSRYQTTSLCPKVLNICHFVIKCSAAGHKKNDYYIAFLAWCPIWSLIEQLHVQVNLCQKLLFLHQLTHNITTDCSLNYKFNTWKFQAQTWGEHVVNRNYFCFVKIEALATTANQFLKKLRVDFHVLNLKFN